MAGEQDSRAGVGAEARERRRLRSLLFQQEAIQGGRRRVRAPAPAPSRGPRDARPRARHGILARPSPRRRAPPLSARGRRVRPPQGWPRAHRPRHGSGQDPPGARRPRALFPRVARSGGRPGLHALALGGRPRAVARRSAPPRRRLRRSRRRVHLRRSPRVESRRRLLPAPRQPLHPRAGGGCEISRRGGGREPLPQGSQGEAHAGARARPATRASMRLTLRDAGAEPPEGSLPAARRHQTRRLRQLLRLRPALLRRQTPTVGVELRRRVSPRGAAPSAGGRIHAPQAQSRRRGSTPAQASGTREDRTLRRGGGEDARRARGARETRHRAEGRVHGGGERRRQRDRGVFSGGAIRGAARVERIRTSDGGGEGCRRGGARGGTRGGGHETSLLRAPPRDARRDGERAARGARAARSGGRHHAVVGARLGGAAVSGGLRAARGGAQHPGVRAGTDAHGGVGRGVRGAALGPLRDAPGGGSGASHGTEKPSQRQVPVRGGYRGRHRVARGPAQTRKSRSRARRRSRDTRRRGRRGKLPHRRRWRPRGADGALRGELGGRESVHRRAGRRARLLVG